MFQAAVATVERDATVESVVDLHFGAGEAETAGLLRDLEAGPSHCTTLSLLTMRSCTKQQIRSRLSGAARHAVSVSRGCRAKRRL
jgi:hypothetical protein